MTAGGHSTIDNPFPGLRPFNEGEQNVFFGRERQVDRMVDKIASKRFLAVIGGSGSGKSSLVNCGFKPALRRGLLAAAGTSWRMVQIRPSGGPIRALAQGLAHTESMFTHVSADYPLPTMLEATLRLSSLGLANSYKQARLDAQTNLLVVVDQFEELFRYRNLPGGGVAERAEEASAFVRLLLSAVAQSEYPIYVVLTMRSDFLGDCAQFDGLSEAINEGQYLVPRLTRDERRSAVEGPILAAGATISPVLLNELVNGVGDNPDQLSILQHALNRTWQYWQHEGGRVGPIALQHYEAIGTMASALDKHANKAFSELVPERLKPAYDKVLEAFTEGGADPGSIRRTAQKADLQQIVSDATDDDVRDILKSFRLQLICERVFKALTDRSTDPRGIRRPVRFGELCRIVDATEAEVCAVLEVFRKPSRSFLMPDDKVKIGPDDVVDISHESFMRLWKRLNKWANDEVESAREYRRLMDRALGFCENRLGLMQDPDLQSTLDFEKRQRPTIAWAQLYGGGLEEACSFLRVSEFNRDELRAKREVERLWQTKWQPAIFATIAISFLVAVFWKAEWYIPNESLKALKMATKSRPNEFLRAVFEHGYELKDILKHFGLAILLAVAFAGMCLALIYYGNRLYHRLRDPAVLMAIQNPPVEAAKASERTPADVAAIARATYAGWSRRVLAFVIDTLIEIVLIIGSAVLLDHINRDPSGNVVLLYFFLMLVVLPCCYHALLVGSRWQATPGMWLSRVYAAMLDGSRVSRKRAFARQFIKLVLSPASWLWPIVYVLVRWRVPDWPVAQRKQWLGDWILKTVVLTRAKKTAANASSVELQKPLPAAS